MSGRRGPSARWRRSAGPPADRPSRVTNESSPRTRSAASRATAVPLPMATPTSACWRAGASLTPSPVTATVRPIERAARTSRSFCSGVARATTWRSAIDARSVASSIVSSSGPVRIRSPESPAARAIVAAVVGWSPVTTTVWMPASVAVRSASGIPVAERVGERQDRPWLPRLVIGSARQKEEPSPGVGCVVDGRLPGSRPVGVPAQREDRLRGAEG